MLAFAPTISWYPPRAIQNKHTTILLSLIHIYGARVTGTVLRSGAVINVPTQVFAFSGGLLHYHEHKSGISVQLLNVYKTVKNRNTGKPLNIVDGTSFEIEPNSFVAVSYTHLPMPPRS